MTWPSFGPKDPKSLRQNRQPQQLYRYTIEIGWCSLSVPSAWVPQSFQAAYWMTRHSSLEGWLCFQHLSTQVTPVSKPWYPLFTSKSLRSMDDKGMFIPFHSPPNMLQYNKLQSCYFMLFQYVSLVLIPTQIDGYPRPPMSSPGCRTRAMESTMARTGSAKTLRPAQRCEVSLRRKRHGWIGTQPDLSVSECFEAQFLLNFSDQAIFTLRTT